MSDVMQLLAADIANKSRISMIWVDLLIKQDLPLHIAAVEQMSPYMLRTRASVICTLWFMLSAKYAGYAI